MKPIKGRKLYAFAFAGALAALIIAEFVAGLNASWYHVPMFVSAFAFAFLYYKADMPNMWSYLLAHMIAFLIYFEGQALIHTGAPAAAGVGAASAFAAIGMLMFMSSVGVAPVCIAYWSYKLTRKRRG